MRCAHDPLGRTSWVGLLGHISSTERLLAAFLAGPWTREALVERGMQTVDAHRAWMRRLVGRVWRAFGDRAPADDVERLGEVVQAFLEAAAPPGRALITALAKTPRDEAALLDKVRALTRDDSLDDFVRWICEEPDARWSERDLARALRERMRGRSKSRRYFFYEGAMQRVEPPVCEWHRTPLPTVGDLCEWLGVEPGRLEWLCDRWRREPRASEQTRHYHYAWKGRRLIEAPKRQLKAIQRRILDGVLGELPPHPAAVAFRPGLSVVEGAARHLGQPVVVRLDLRDFFTSVRHARVLALFRRLGYPPQVAGRLAALTTHATPPTVWRAGRPAGEDRSAHWVRGRRFVSRHLPQGAPSSPALANLCVFGLDVRLTALAETFGATYTRYADDLVFSGALRAAPLIHRVGLIVEDEGFVLNRAKTKVMRAAQRQQVTGVVVNQRPNLSRADYDRLNAILTNCARHGPHAQNRAGHPHWRAHLEGRVAWAEALSSTRGRRLRARLDEIDWSAP